jgi:ribosomal protein S18 acetylase RimI-like enzyme
MGIRAVVKTDEAQLRIIAKNILEPLYGSQEKAINEWLTGNGYKNAFVFLQNGKIAGLLSMKANPSKNFLKISTLVVVEDFRGMKIGRQMLDFAFKFTKEKGFKNIIVTVSESKPKAVSFFQNSGFETVETCLGKYIEGVNELIMIMEAQ